MQRIGSYTTVPFLVVLDFSMMSLSLWLVFHFDFHHLCSIPGDVNLVMSSPPLVTIEIFDWDVVGKPDFLGRAFATPVVKTNKEVLPTPTKLQW